MQIKALSAATGVDVETIRYYERQGLLPAPARQANGYRDYGQPQLERLAFIRHCRALDMPLAAVRQLLGALDAPGPECGAVNQGALAPLALAQGSISSPVPSTMVARNASASTAAGWVGRGFFMGAGWEG